MDGRVIVGIRQSDTASWRAVTTAQLSADDASGIVKV